MKFSSFADLINQVKGKSNRVVVPGANNKEALNLLIAKMFLPCVNWR